MRHGSLFSGIGGFDLAAEWMGWENVFQVEWDSYCQKVLAKNFPSVKRYGDIKEFDGTKYMGLIDIISGGFPCQPFSHAGKRKGKEDDRYLWPEMLRVIREIKPSFIVGENVAGLVSMERGKTLDRILSDLANEGYQTEQFIIPACGVGAWHERERLFIIGKTTETAYKTEDGWICRKCGIGVMEGCGCYHGEWECLECGEWTYPFYYESKDGCQWCGSNNIRISTPEEFTSNNSIYREPTGISKQESWKEGITEVINNSNCRNGKENIWSIEPELGRVAYGIPNRVDRLKGLGNAIVPQVVYQIFKAIEQYENDYLCDS